MPVGTDSSVDEEQKPLAIALRPSATSRTRQIERYERSAVSSRSSNGVIQGSARANFTHFESVLRADHAFLPNTSGSLLTFPRASGHCLAERDAGITTREDEVLMHVSSDLVSGAPPLDGIEKHVEMIGRHRVAKDRRVGGHFRRWAKAFLRARANGTAVARAAEERTDRRVAETMSVLAGSKRHDVGPRCGIETIALADHTRNDASLRRAIVVGADARSRSAWSAGGRRFESRCASPGSQREEPDHAVREKPATDHPWLSSVRALHEQGDQS
jgi:hypothetical protein